MQGAFSLGAWATAESKDRLEQKLCGYRVVLQTLRGDDPGIDCTLLLAKGHLAEYVPQRSMALRPQEHCHSVRTIIHYTILCHIVEREGQIVGCFMISAGPGGEGGRGQNGGELAVKEGPAGAEEGVGLGGGGGEENCLELAKMDWNEGKGQVKEGAAGVGVENVRKNACQ